MIKTHETARPRAGRIDVVRTKNATRAMPITPGIHEPDKPYAVPDSEHAWGEGRLARKIGAELLRRDQYETQRDDSRPRIGRIDHIGLANHEVRLREEDSSLSRTRRISRRDRRIGNRVNTRTTVNITI